VVVVDVNGYDERQWSESEQDRAVLGIVAHAVSRILENSSNPRHPAIPELQRLVDEARDLAPFP
jgi:hypothetical protein